MKVRITKVPDKKNESLNAAKWKHGDGGFIRSFDMGGPAVDPEEERRSRISNSRYNMAYDALVRSGVPEADSARLAGFLGAQSLAEAGWVESTPSNNYAGYMLNGKKMKFDSPESFWDYHVKNLGEKWPLYKDAQTIDDYYNAINHAELGLDTPEKFKAYNKKHVGNEVYLYAPAWENTNYLGNLRSLYNKRVVPYIPALKMRFGGNMNKYDGLSRRSSQMNTADDDYLYRIASWQAAHPGQLWADTPEASSARQWLAQNRPDDFASMYWAEDEDTRRGIDPRFIPERARERSMEDAVRARDAAAPYVAGALASPIVAGEALAAGLAAPGVVSSAASWLSNPANQMLVGKIATPLLGGAALDSGVRATTPYYSWGNALYNSRIPFTNQSPATLLQNAPGLVQGMAEGALEMTNPAFYAPYGAAATNWARGLADVRSPYRLSSEEALSLDPKFAVETDVSTQELPFYGSDSFAGLPEEERLARIANGGRLAEASVPERPMTAEQFLAPFGAEPVPEVDPAFDWDAFEALTEPASAIRVPSPEAAASVPAPEAPRRLRPRRGVMSQMENTSTAPVEESTTARIPETDTAAPDVLYFADDDGRTALQRMTVQELRREAPNEQVNAELRNRARERYGVSESGSIDHASTDQLRNIVSDYISLGDYQLGDLDAGISYGSANRIDLSDLRRRASALYQQRIRGSKISDADVGLLDLNISDYDLSDLSPQGLRKLVSRARASSPVADEFTSKIEQIARDKISSRIENRIGQMSLDDAINSNYDLDNVFGLADEDFHHLDYLSRGGSWSSGDSGFDAYGTIKRRLREKIDGTLKSDIGIELSDSMPIENLTEEQRSYINKINSMANDLYEDAAIGRVVNLPRLYRRLAAYETTGKDFHQELLKAARNKDADAFRRIMLENRTDSRSEIGPILEADPSTRKFLIDLEKERFSNLDGKRLINQYVGKLYDIYSARAGNLRESKAYYLDKSEIDEPHDLDLTALSELIEEKFPDAKGIFSKYSSATDVGKIQKYIREHDLVPRDEPLPLDVEHMNYFGNGRASFDVSSRPMEIFRDIESGGSVLENNTSVDSEPMKLSSVAKHYGTEPGQMTLEYMEDPTDPSGFLYTRRNSYGHSSYHLNSDGTVTFGDPNTMRRAFPDFDQSAVYFTPEEVNQLENILLHGSPRDPLTAEENALVERWLDIVRKTDASAMAKYNKARALLERVSGRSYLPPRALDRTLWDAGLDNKATYLSPWTAPYKHRLGGFLRPYSGKPFSYGGRVHKSKKLKELAGQIQKSYNKEDILKTIKTLRCGGKLK